jgi:Domain of unknown function DUF1829/Domain of unknown function DUF1828
MTNVDEISRLVDNYRSWLKDRTAIKSVHADWVEISTPFLDRHNDYIQLYAKGDKGKYEITDDGHTLRDLEMSGCSLDTPKRQALLKVSLNGFGVEERDGILRVRAATENFSVRKHALIQAVLAVNDMFYLASSTVKSLFKEDVEKWLFESDIRYVPNVQFPGRSGYQHNFDFAIPRSKKAPERILKALTNPNRDSAVAFIAAWVDTIDQRPKDATAMAFLNDNERSVAGTVVSALEQYDIEPVLWSKREATRDRLLA